MEENRLFNNWNRALLVSLQLPRRSTSDVQNSLQELSSLAYSLGGDVVGKIIQVSSHIHPANFFGKGKLSEIKSTIQNYRVDAKFQRVKEILILDSFPRNVAGKTLKREMREAYLNS